MEAVVRYVDQWGREIVLDADTWHLHILPDRPMLAGNDDLVDAARTDPSDGLLDATHAARESSYPPMRSPRSGRRLYLKVCVEFEPEGPSDFVRGQVLIAYPTTKIKRGERPKWKR